VPGFLDFSAFTVFATNYPAYKVFMLVFSIVILVGLIFLLTRTRAGLIIQASLTHPNMVGMLGHNVPRVFMMVFGLGTSLAAIAGAIAGAAFVTQSNMAALLGPILFVVVVVGGLGSLWGAFIASLLIGLLQTFAISSSLSLSKIFGGSFTPTSGTILYDVWTVTIAQIGPILPYLLLVLVLVFRPTGLFGTRDT
jgi:branched-chain amino acid transport system permease protein